MQILQELGKIMAEPWLVKKICSSDEDTFCLNVHVNKKIHLYWTTENLPLFRERPQRPQKIRSETSYFIISVRQRLDNQYSNYWISRREPVGMF